MRIITATDLKSNTGDFFDALLMDGGVIITRNGKEFHLKLVRNETGHIPNKEKAIIENKSEMPQDLMESQERPEEEKSHFQQLVDAIGALAKSIPVEERDAVGRDMMAALEEHRAEENRKRVAEME